MNRRSLNALVFVATMALAIVATDARQEQKPEVKKWDVADATGPTTALAFDTDEGTWMNVDVSPDGTQIVFDLLGDIYLMPIGGSATPARRLTSGPAFDMQPRFSPDGKRIAMTSDRDGLWNIWTVDVASKDGKDGKQISREKRWFVNSPTWSPDGSYIYARRHFVKERSLGSGEIWMYHAAAANDGLQVTEKNGWQKDAGEPDVSPDGVDALLQQGRHARSDVRIQQGSERNDLRHHPPRPDNRARAPRRQRAGRIGDAAGIARRQVTRVSSPRSSAELSLRPRSRDRPRPAALRQRRQGPAGSVGNPRALSAVRVDAGRQVDRHLG